MSEPSKNTYINWTQVADADIEKEIEKSGKLSGNGSYAMPVCLANYIYAKASDALDGARFPTNGDILQEDVEFMDPIWMVHPKNHEHPIQDISGLLNVPKELKRFLPMSTEDMLQDEKVREKADDLIEFINVKIPKLGRKYESKLKKLEKAIEKRKRVRDNKRIPLMKAIEDWKACYLAKLDSDKVTNEDKILESDSVQRIIKELELVKEQKEKDLKERQEAKKE